MGNFLIFEVLAGLCLISYVFKAQILDVEPGSCTPHLIPDDMQPFTNIGIPTEHLPKNGSYPSDVVADMNVDSAPFYVVEMDPNKTQQMLLEWAHHIRFYGTSDKCFNHNFVKISLNFEFPFYGNAFRNITITRGGFLYIHGSINDTRRNLQYIMAPLMAAFETNTNLFKGVICYSNRAESLKVRWEMSRKVNNKNAHLGVGVMLRDNGDIFVIYDYLPNHLFQLVTQYFVKIGIFTVYDKSLDGNEPREKPVCRGIAIYYPLYRPPRAHYYEKVGTGITFTPKELPCSKFQTCHDCLLNSHPSKLYVKCPWCTQKNTCVKTRTGMDNSSRCGSDYLRLEELCYDDLMKDQRRESRDAETKGSSTNTPFRKLQNSEEQVKMLMNDDPNPYRRQHPGDKIVEELRPTYFKRQESQYSPVGHLWPQMYIFWIIMGMLVGGFLLAGVWSCARGFLFHEMKEENNHNRIVTPGTSEEV